MRRTWRQWWCAICSSSLFLVLLLHNSAMKRMATWDFSHCHFSLVATPISGKKKMMTTHCLHVTIVFSFVVAQLCNKRFLCHRFFFSFIAMPLVQKEDDDDNALLVHHCHFWLLQHNSMAKKMTTQGFPHHRHYYYFVATPFNAKKTTRMTC